MYLRILLMGLLLVLLATACVPSTARRPAGPAAEPVTDTSPVATRSLRETPEALTPTAAATRGIPATHTPAPTPTVAVSSRPDQDAELQALADATQRIPRDEVALAQALAGVPEAETMARTTPLEVQPGDVQEFFVTSTASDQTYPVVAELRYAGPVVLMYVEQGLAVDQVALEADARTFEQQIYERTRGLFGSERQPGVDGDPRITILNGRSPGGGVAGYFSSRDLVPRSVNRFSNEREMFFMNVESIRPGEPAYLDVLAHEFQHMIHWNEQRNAAIWFNEGCSTLSEDLNGFVNHGFVYTYLADPDVQLTSWSEEPGHSIAHYGASHLFMRYIYAQYVEEEGLTPLIRADAGNHPDVFVELASARHPDITRFGELFGNWAVANLLDDPELADGRYGYGDSALLPNTVVPVPLERGEYADSVQQFGVDYLELPEGALTVHFRGSTSVELVGAGPRDGYAWWSGRGDNSVSTLTHAVDLRNMPGATLQFDTWYELEQSYDYAFVSLSTDGGVTWQTLPGQHTTNHDPHGVNYGNGFNGVSGTPDVPTSSGTRGEWVTEQIDLAAYAGQPALLRFWQVSDDAFNAPGLMVDNIRVCSRDDPAQCVLADDVEDGSGAWQAEGFARVDGALKQYWELRLVRTDAAGQTSVEQLAVDAEGNATVTVEPNERAIMVISAITPHTTEPANYRVLIED